MITLFRRIRQKLIDSGSTTRYMLYAIGEVMLVVIGILIALQVNNWNEERIEDQVELRMLSEIRDNLELSKAEIEDVIEYNITMINSYSYILDHIEQQKPLNDSLYVMFGDIQSWASPYLTYTAYESLKQKGIDLIENRSLRSTITDLYENSFTYLMEDWDDTEWRDNEVVVTPYFAKNFEYQKRPLFSIRTRRGEAYPNDYDALLRDQEFQNVLSLLIINRSWGVESCTYVLEEIDQVIAEIDLELSERG